MKRDLGMALLELALCVVILGVLGIVLIRPLALARAAHDHDLTRAQLADIRTALLGYAQSNGRLPCPAEPGLALGTAGAGMERSLVDDDCAGGYGGVVPWVTLGVRETDAWGHRFSYRVARTHANALNECDGTRNAPSICLAATPAANAPANPDALEVRIRVRVDRVVARSVATEPTATGLVAVIVSHGPNGHLGANGSGRRYGADRAIGADERRNADPASISFVSGKPRPGVNGCDDEDERKPLCAFDDRIEWLGRAEVQRALARSGSLR